MTFTTSEWLRRGNAAGMIVFNDPVWAEQEYAMQRGDRPRGPYDPPLPDHFVDALLDHQKRLSALADLMAVEGRASLDDDHDPHAWVAVDGDMLIAGRYADRRGIRWMPKALFNEYHTLATAPLPCSADLPGKPDV